MLDLRYNNKGDTMSRTEAKEQATYTRHLIRLLLAETNPVEREDIANELVASALQINEYLKRESN